MRHKNEFLSEAREYARVLQENQIRMEQILYSQMAEQKRLASEIKELKETVRVQSENFGKCLQTGMLQEQSLTKEMESCICMNREILQLQRKRTPLTLLRVAFHLADHCNLNCKCCDHFSPIAKEKLADFKAFASDMKRLGKLCEGYIGRISLQGGEPLLHPNAIDFAVAARENFPIGSIAFTTNGILLLKQKESFWKTCAQYRISIEITKYPIDLDYEQIQKTAYKFGVHCSFFGNTDLHEKSTYRIPIDVTGSQDIYRNFAKCFHANECIMLKNGRLFTCTVAPNIEHFNWYFGENVVLSELDSIDIYQAESMEQITEFLSKPIPFCRYCNVAGREFGLTWGKSEKDISEWTKESREG